jgi:hypothetical protein
MTITLTASFRAVRITDVMSLLGLASGPTVALGTPSL